jgi:hypothetical protein
MQWGDAKLACHHQHSPRQIKVSPEKEQTLLWACVPGCAATSSAAATMRNTIAAPLPKLSLMVHVAALDSMQQGSLRAAPVCNWFCCPALSARRYWRADSVPPPLCVAREAGMSCHHRQTCRTCWWLQGLSALAAAVRLFAWHGSGLEAAVVLRANGIILTAASCGLIAWIPPCQSGLLSSWMPP